MFRIFVAGTSLLILSASANGQSRQLLPTRYEAGHFYAVPETPYGQSLRLMVDTGGAGGSGWYVIDPKSALRLGLVVTVCEIGAERFDVVKSLSFRSGKGLPLSPNTPCNSAALVVKDIGATFNGDGVLGAGYLPRHIWTFDYPLQQLWLEPATWRPHVGSHRAALGFQRNAAGKQTTGMARITLKVGGRPLEMLLDTGATARPTAAGKQASGTPTEHGVGVTSYITTSMFDRWSRQHPDWRIVANGDDLHGRPERLIEVPKIEIAGWEVGPVWFTERPDTNFHEFMSNYTDRRIEGAVGGNVFAHFVMTVDYPASTAWFTCVTQCQGVGAE